MRKFSPKSRRNSQPIAPRHVLERTLTHNGLLLNQLRPSLRSASTGTALACQQSGEEYRALVAPVRKNELVETSGQVVPRVCTLDGFAREIDRLGGVDLGRLEPLTCLRIHTRNTEYKITVLAPADSRILLRGGRFAPIPIEAALAGSSFGGHFLKVNWIGVNMRMELQFGEQFIVTSPVRSIEIDSNLPGPF